MNYVVRTNRWGVPMLHKTARDEGLPTVEDAVRDYIRDRRARIGAELANIRYDLNRLPYTDTTRACYQNMNLYLNRLQNCYRKIRMANKILMQHLEEHNKDHGNTRS